MPKYRVIATMDVEMEVFIDAPDEDTAWLIANQDDDGLDWQETGVVTDWTLEGVTGVKRDDVS